VEIVDWDSLQIVETHDDEGCIALMSEKQMCEILGLTEEETHLDEGQMNEQSVDIEKGIDTEQGVDTEGAAIPTSDAIPSEMVISYDKNNPPMDIRTIYPSMEEFKMAVQQFAIVDGR